jgi:hypothetical protein
MTDKATQQQYIPGLNKKDIKETKIVTNNRIVEQPTITSTTTTSSGSTIGPISSSVQQLHTTQVEAESIKTIDKKVIVETVPETHFETKYVTKTVPVVTSVQTQHTMVTAVQETKEIPVTRFVERIENVPIKKFETITEYKTVPVTKLEEITENIPVKKVVAHTEYQKIPVTRLVETIENIPVKRIEQVTEYQTVTVTRPVNPTEVPEGVDIKTMDTRNY